MPTRDLAIMALGQGNFDRVEWPRYDIWTLNDWYRRWRKLTNPQRVYQIHNNVNIVDGMRGRYINWRNEYENSGALIVVGKPMGFKNERVFDWQKAVEYRGFAGWFGCTLCYMLHDAEMEGYKRIKLVGVELRNGEEYAYQFPSLQRAVKELRSKGIEIEWPEEDGLEQTRVLVEWDKLQSINVMGYGRSV